VAPPSMITPGQRPSSNVSPLIRGSADGNDGAVSVGVTAHNPNQVLVPVRCGPLRVRLPHSARTELAALR